MVDGGFVGHEQVEQASAHTTVYGPVPATKDKTVDPHQPKPNDSPGVAAWRARMGTDEAKAIYKNRAATAECVNAQSRNRGLQQLRVRGLAKVKCVVLFFALAHNLMRMASLAPEMLAFGKGARWPVDQQWRLKCRGRSGSARFASMVPVACTAWCGPSRAASILKSGCANRRQWQPPGLDGGSRRIPHTQQHVQLLVAKRE